MRDELGVFGSAPPIDVEWDATDAAQLTLKAMITPWWILLAAWGAAGLILALLGHPLIGAAQTLSGMALDTAIQTHLRRRLIRKAARSGVRGVGPMVFARFALGVAGPLAIVLWRPSIPAITVLVLLQAWSLCVAVVQFGHARRLMACALGPVLAALWIGLTPQISTPGGLAVLTALALLSGVVLIVGKEVNLLCWTWILATRRNTDLQRELTLARDEALAEREEAARANAAKSEFLAVMSHEIRTPLNGVLGMVQIMAEGQLTAVQRRRLDVVRQSGADLLAVLNDILDLSKIEAGRLELEEIDFELGELLAGVHANFKGVAEAKGVAFVLEAKTLPAVVRGDAGRLRQILSNLVSNALKFTAEGEVRIVAGHAADQLTLEVFDTGIGMAPETLDRLFESYAQADASTARTFGGTGLGLSIVRQLADLMGGTIQAVSTLGRGSCFALSVPLRVVTPAAGASVASDLRVLVADDHPVNRLVLMTLLQQAGVEPVVVENGHEAVEAWRGKTWDVVLMDVQMPVMDGVSAALAIRAQETALRRRRTPIIALTGDTLAHQIAGYLAAGMDDYLPKPIEAARLYAALAKLKTTAPA